MPFRCTTTFSSCHRLGEARSGDNKIRTKAGHRNRRVGIVVHPLKGDDSVRGTILECLQDVFRVVLPVLVMLDRASLHLDIGCINASESKKTESDKGRVENHP